MEVHLLEISSTSLSHDSVPTIFSTIFGLEAVIVTDCAVFLLREGHSYGLHRFRLSFVNDSLVSHFLRQVLFLFNPSQDSREWAVLLSRRRAFSLASTQAWGRGSIPLSHPKVRMEYHSHLL